MWLSKSSKSSRDDERTSQASQTAIGSQQWSQHRKGGPSSHKRRRLDQQVQDHTDNNLQPCEKPSPAKKTRAALSSYEDDVSDDEFVVIELFSSDEQEKSSTCSSSKTKSHWRSHSKTSQKKKSPVSSIRTATNSQVSPIYNTTSIFKRFQNQNESRESRGKSGEKDGNGSGPMFTQQEMETDLPLLPWPKKRVTSGPSSHSSNSNESQGSQSPKGNSSAAVSVSQTLEGIISKIREDSSSDSDETFASMIQKKVFNETVPVKTSVSKTVGLADSYKKVSPEFGKPCRDLSVVKGKGQRSKEVSPVFLSLRTSKLSLKKKTPGNVSSDSLSDFVVVETVSEDSSKERSTKEETDTSDNFLTIGRKSKCPSKISTNTKTSETNNNFSTRLKTGREGNSFTDFISHENDFENTVSAKSKGQSAIAGKRKKKGYRRKSFQLTSSDSDDDLPTLKLSSSFKHESGSKKVQMTNTLGTISVAKEKHSNSRKTKHGTPVDYSSDDISCHSTESTDEYTYASQQKNKATTSDDEDLTKKYEFDSQSEKKTCPVPADFSLVVSQNAKEKLKKIASCTGKREQLETAQAVDDDNSTHEYLFEESIVEAEKHTLIQKTKSSHIRLTEVTEVAMDSNAKVADSDEDMTQAPDTVSDSHEDDNSDIIVMGLEEGLTQIIDSPKPDEDDEMTQEPSQSWYGNPPQLSLACRTDSSFSRKNDSIPGGPPQLTQQISKPASRPCVSPASTIAYDSDSWHSNNTDTFPNYDHENQRKIILKRIGSRSGGSTDSYASESCLKFTGFASLQEHTKNIDNVSVCVSQKENSLKNPSNTDKRVQTNEEACPCLEKEDEKTGKDVCQTELQGTETVLGLQSKGSTSKLSSSKSVAFSIDIPIAIKKEELSDGPEDTKIKQEILETKQVSELPSKLPCYTQEEDVIFVYDSSDDEALIDLSQTNVRSDHLSDTDSLYGMFDHSDTELFDDDFSDHDVTVVNEGGHGMGLDDLALEEKNPFDHLGESDSEDSNLATAEARKKTDRKSTFDFDKIVDHEVPVETSSACDKRGKKFSILEVSSDSDNDEAVLCPKSAPETSGHDSFEMDLDDDVYMAATHVVDNTEECDELLDAKENNANVFKPIHIESDSSLYSALTEVTATDSDSDSKEIQPRKPDFGTTRKNWYKSKQCSDGVKSPDNLSDEDLYMATTQMDSNVTSLLKDSTVKVKKPKDETSKELDTNLVVASSSSQNEINLSVGSQGKPKRKTASVRSFNRSSLENDFKSPSMSTSLSLNKKIKSVKSIFDADTQIDHMCISSNDPFKTSTPKIPEGRPKSSLFQLKKLNFQDMYDAQTQPMSPPSKSSMVCNAINLEHSDDEPDDEALYKALDDLEETDLSCLEVTGQQDQITPNKCLPSAGLSHVSRQEAGNKVSSHDNHKYHTSNHVSKNMQDDVYFEATQIDPMLLRLGVSDSEGDDNECVDMACNEDPFDVMTQVDEPLPAKGPKITNLKEEDASLKKRGPALLMKKIMSKHVQNKSILVDAERLKKKPEDKKENNKDSVEKKKRNSLPIRKSTFYKTPTEKGSWLSKKRSPPVLPKPGSSAASKRKKKPRKEESFSLTQNIKAAKQRQKERASKTVCNPSLPTAKMKHAALHTSNSDVLPPDEEEIMAKGLPLLTFTRLVDKKRYDKDYHGDDHEAGTPVHTREEEDMEVENSGSLVTSSVSGKVLPSSSVLGSRDFGKVKDVNDKKKTSGSSKSSSSKLSVSSSDSLSRSSKSGSTPSKLSPVLSKSLNRSDTSEYGSSKSAKSKSLSGASGSSKPVSSSRPHSSSASKKSSSHPSSSSSRSSKHSHTSSKPSSISLKPSSTSANSSSSSSKYSSSKISSSSKSSFSSSKSSSSSSKPSSSSSKSLPSSAKSSSTSANVSKDVDLENKNSLSEKDSVSSQHKKYKDPSKISTGEQESVVDVISKEASDAVPSTAASTTAPTVTHQTCASTTNVQKTQSFDLSLYPLPSVKVIDKRAKTRVSPQLPSELKVRSRSPVNEFPLGGHQDTEVDQSCQKALVLQDALKKTSAYPAPARLSTPPPAHHANDLPMEKLLKKLSEDDPRKTVKKQQVSTVAPLIKTGVTGVTKDPKSALSHGQPRNLLLKPSAAVRPVVEGTLPVQRPVMGNRANVTILPFSQMLKGTAVQPITSVNRSAREVKDVKDPSKLMDSTYYMSRVLSWNPVWLNEQSKPEFAGHPPPILESSESLYPLLESYTNVEDYQNIMTRLLLLETWDMVFKEWKQTNTKTVTNVMFLSVDICNKQKGGLSKFIWQGVLTREQFRRNQYPLENDLIIMNVWGVPLALAKDRSKSNDQPFWKAQFGYVERVNIRPSDNIHNLLRTYPILKSSVEKAQGEYHILTVTALGRYRRFRPIGDRMMSVQPLCNMVTARRQFQALTYLPRSPLLRDILHPSSHRVFHHNTLVHDTSLLKVYNQSQAQAISAVCRAVREPVHMPRICLLQGPPGTGKTHTITGIITKIIQESQGKCCICLCTPSNGAADELMRRLITIRNKGGRNSSMRLVRFGKIKSIHEDVLECSYDELVDKERKKEEDHKKRNLSSLPESVKREQQQLQQKIDRVQKELASFSVTANKIQVDRRQADLKKFERELRYLDKQQSTPHQFVQLSPAEESRIRQRVLQDAHVICGTLNSVGSARIMGILRSERNRNRNPFLCTIIDEATQSTELDCLIPLQYGVSKLVLVGDPEQLPPTILSQRAKEMKFGLSLFERFYSYFKSKDQTAVMMLKTQYRMDPAILTFPNLYVYDGLLNTDRSVVDRTKNFPLHPYLVLNIESGQEVISSEGSVSNQIEANCVAELCHLIVSRTKILPFRIGVICPYQSQRAMVVNSLSHYRLRDVEAGTVDGFQGREKHIIIMSCVRARSVDGSIGFLSDRRRMNVALTRAKYALYVLGHLDTLKRGPDWRALIDDAQRRNVIINIPSVNQFSSVAVQCFKAPKAPH